MANEDPLTHCYENTFRRLLLGDVEFDERSRSVIAGDQTAQLTDLSWRFLKALVDQAPEPADAELLSQRVWGTSHVSAETIAQRARQLRQTLGDSPRSPRYIRTIRGGGYQLIPEVQVVETDSTLPARAPAGRRWRLWSGLALAATALVGALVYRQPSPTTSVPTANPDIEELVRRGNEYRRRATLEDNQIAVDLYRQALAADQDHVDALVGLSLGLSHKSSKYDFSLDFANQAATLADRALVLAPDRYQPWTARGLADDARGRVSSALGYYQRALTIKPDNASTISSSAYLYQVQGKLHHSLRLEAQALEHAPPTYFADFQIAVTLGLAQFGAAADAWLDRAARLRPDNVFLKTYRVEQLLLEQRPEDALALLDRPGRQRLAAFFLRGLALQMAGASDDARAAFAAGQQQAQNHARVCIPCVAMLVEGGDESWNRFAESVFKMSKKAAAEGSEWPEERVHLAMLAAALDQRDLALTHLSDAVTLGYLNYRWLQQLPPLKQLLDQPQGQNLLAAMRQHQADQHALIKADQDLTNLVELN